MLDREIDPAKSPEPISDLASTYLPNFEFQFQILPFTKSLSKVNLALVNVLVVVLSLRSTTNSTLDVSSTLIFQKESVISLADISSPPTIILNS
jgi:hypothetical protein